VPRQFRFNGKRMGKDREGKFHPRKGKPGGEGKQKGITEPQVSKKVLVEQFDLEEKYLTDPDADRADGTLMRHPNRNVEKHTDRQKTERQKNNSDKSRNETFTENFSSVTPREIAGEVTKDILASLASYSGPCVTIYLPTHRTGTEVNEQVDRILFKNFIQQAASALRQQVSDNTTSRMFEPAYELLRNEEFWRTQSPGVAFFITDGFFNYIKLPAAPEQEVWVNSTFLLSPLVPFVLRNEYFYLLVISKKQSKLFRVDNFQARYVEIPALPHGIMDVVHLEEKEDQKLFRTGSSGAGGGANYHGMGAGKPDEKENISMYLAEVDNTLWSEVLHRENVPLVLAGVDYLIPLYKKVTRYRHVWDEPIIGSLEHENEQELFRLARKNLEPYFQARTEKALAEYGNRSATALTSSIADDVIPAAYYGRIAHLFVRKDERLWGTFDEKTNVLRLHVRQEPGDYDLLDKAILQTLMNGGEVHLLEQDRMPAQSKLAAIMRYG
jgi:hypothetical protein